MSTAQVVASPITPLMCEAVSTILSWMYGGSVPAEIMENTPRRFMSMLAEMTSSCRNDLDSQVKFRAFETSNDEMVVLSGIPFWSLCEHHLVPFHGVVTVGYLPDGKAIGLSKIPRLVQYYARKPQLQERMTAEIASTFMERLECLGAGVIVKARHLCVEMRGAKSKADTTTSCLLGKFRDAHVKAEFIALANGGK